MGRRGIILWEFFYVFQSRNLANKSLDGLDKTSCIYILLNSCCLNHLLTIFLEHVRIMPLFPIFKFINNPLGVYKFKDRKKGHDPEMFKKDSEQMIQTVRTRQNVYTGCFVKTTQTLHSHIP